MAFDAVEADEIKCKKSQYGAGFLAKGQKTGGPRVVKSSEKRKLPVSNPWLFYCHFYVFNIQALAHPLSVHPDMSLQSDVDLLFKVFDALQDLMEHHEAINTTLTDLAIQENDQDFTPLENASAAIIATCEKIEKQLNPKSSSCCC